MISQGFGARSPKRGARGGSPAFLALTLPHRAAILAATRAAAPAEACGLLVGRGRRILRVTRLVPAANLLAHVPGRFELDPLVRLRTERECRGGGERVIGHWHSHPDGPARPSATDLAMAYEPDLVWLIAGRNRDLRAWRLEGGSFAPVPLIPAAGMSDSCAVGWRGPSWWG